MPRMGRDTFARIVVSDGAGHYVRLPRLTTTQRDALTAQEGMIISNSTTDTIQAYINSAWRNMDAQMLAAYLPLAGGTMTGDINIGANKLITTAASLYEIVSGRLAVRDATGIEYREFICSLFHFVTGITAAADAIYIAAPAAGNDYLILKAFDTGDALAEIARLQGAAAAHLLLTRAKFSVAAHAADVNHRGFLYFTEGTTGVADKLYCIMKKTDDSYEATQVATPA